MCYYIYSPTITQYISGFISGKALSVAFWYSLTPFHFGFIHIAHTIKYIRFTYWNIHSGHPFIMGIVVVATVQIVLSVFEDKGSESRRIETVEHLNWGSVWPTIYYS